MGGKEFWRRRSEGNKEGGRETKDGDGRRHSEAKVMEESCERERRRRTICGGKKGGKDERETERK